MVDSPESAVDSPRNSSGETSKLVRGPSANDDVDHLDLKSGLIVTEVKP